MKTAKKPTIANTWFGKRPCLGGCRVAASRIITINVSSLDVHTTAEGHHKADRDGDDEGVVMVTTANIQPVPLGRPRGTYELPPVSPDNPADELLIGPARENTRYPTSARAHFTVPNSYRIFALPIRRTGAGPCG
jgi:hypothetical protein